MSTHAIAHHNFWLLMLAVAICAASALASLTIYAHLLSRVRSHANAWLLLTGFCAGAGTWATHFVGMLAHDTGLPTRYGPVLTIISFAVAVAVMTAGFAVSLPPKREVIGAGGAIIGLGIAAMHFIGMQAVSIAGTFQWNIGLVILSILFSIGFSTGALIVFRQWRGLYGYLLAALFLALGICLLHLTAMAALTIEPHPNLPPSASNVDDTTLAIAIASVTALILLAGYVVALMDGRALRDAFVRTRELVDAAIDGLIIANDGIIVNVNARVVELCGRKNEELVGKGLFGEVFSGSVRYAAVNTQRVFAAALVQADGATVPVEVVCRPLRGLSQGNEVYAIHDLREREAAARQLAIANQELAQRQEDLRARNLIMDDALSAMSQGLCMYDANQQVVVCNQRFSTIYGLPADAVQPGMHLREVVQKRIDNGVYAGSSPTAYMEERLAPVLKEERNIHELNDGRLIAIARRPFSGGGWLTTHDDITEQKRMEAQLKQLKDHDGLTGLLTRASFRDALAEALQAAYKRDRRIAVFAIGIDRFNDFSETLGHAAGDSLLKSIAERLQENTRRATTLGRIGDDTFGIIEFVEHPEKDAAGFANRTLDEIRKPITVGNTTLKVTATIGIATSPVAGRDADTLLKNAALAQKRGKVDARGSFHFFDPAMGEELRTRRALEQELAEALEKQQFELLYQPRVNLARNEVTGFETLLRWRHPTKGLLEPGSFLPVAEKLSLVGPIGEWMLQRACTEAAHWPERFVLAASLSAEQISTPGFGRSIINVLAATGLPADRLQLEISEKVVRSYEEEATTILRELSHLGVRITMTDFGSGFSSLAYLRQFPVQKIKIDRSFVAGLGKQADAQVIVRMLARLGSGFSMETMVEGIETKEQLELVRAEGYTEIQGHYFSAPKTSEEISGLFPAIVERERKKVAQA